MNDVTPRAGTDDPNDQDVYRKELKKKTRSSVLWTLCRIASDQVFSFVVFVILARLLSPHEVGTFAIATVFSEVGRTIAISGMVQNIPRAKTLTPTLVDTVFWSNLGMAFVVAIVVLLFAHPLLGLIGQPEAAAPLQALGFVLPIAALGATHLSLRLREFGHKSLALRSLAGGTIGGTAAVIAAFAGCGVWSLVVQRFVTESVNAVMSWHAYKWLPGTAFSLDQLRKTAGFGANLTITQLIGLMQRRAQDVIIGAMIGAQAVGFYRIAWRTSELITAGAIQPFTTVALQTMSRLQEDREGLVNAYRWMVSKSSMISFPALIGFGVLAPDAVPAIYGAKWAEAAHLAQIFAFLVVPVPLASFSLPLLTALGKSSSVRTQAILQMSLTLALTFIAAPYGVFAVACAYVGRTYLTLPFLFWFMRRATGIGVRDAVGAIMAPLGASIIMAAGVWVLMTAIRSRFATAVFPLIIAVAAGAVIYALALYAISPDARGLARQQWKRIRGRGKEADRQSTSPRERD